MFGILFEVPMLYAAKGVAQVAIYGLMVVQLMPP